MVIQGETGSKGTAAIATRYPVTEGLTAATTKQTGTEMTLVPEEGSKVTQRQREGL